MPESVGASVFEDTAGEEAHCTGRSTPLTQRYVGIRRFTEKLCQSLTPEDCAIQSMPDVSPTRWHLAHTSWFFETFVLRRAIADYRPFHPSYEILFNSYYNSVGQQFPRAQRGLLSRPGLQEVLDYRRAIDERMVAVLQELKDDDPLQSVTELGLHHEQQHQELILTDIKHVLGCNPLYPVYREQRQQSSSLTPSPLRRQSYDGGLQTIGYQGEGFAYDNESPRHKTYIHPFELSTRLASNGEYLAFMEDGGYERPELWLSMGWQQRCEESWLAPLYWVRRENSWWQFTLAGLKPLDLAEPVCHVSYFEADAFARWAHARLPTEAEWELAAADGEMHGNFVEQELFHPAPALSRAGLLQMFGDLWEWTASPYVAYPGYEPAPGALGEYNGKFMCNQYVLRGGSCATPATHIRPTYRNFFPPHARWQFSGIRLAK